MACVATYRGDMRIDYQRDLVIGQRTAACASKDLFSVTATAEELTFIEDHFSNLPTMTFMGMVTWYGDHARFIVGNWNNLVQALEKENG